MSKSNFFIHFHSSFKKDLKKSAKRGKKIEKFDAILEILQNGLSIPEKYKDHKLIGNYEGFRELHIQPDWLLIYKIDIKKNILILYRIGSHSDLF
jgi:mRNA interferase YafQ